MAEAERPVDDVIYLIDIDDEMPLPGQHVLALGLGGKLCETVWTKDSHEFFKAWAKFPKVPKAVKDKLRKRFPIKEET